MESELWGETSENNTDWDTKVVPKEIGKLVILSAIKPEQPKVKQPQPDDDIDLNTIIGPEHSNMEENVLYTIKLIQHARQVSDLIRRATVMEENSNKPPEIEDCPTMPEKPPKSEKDFRETFPPCYIAREESSFTLGEPIHLPQLGRTITKEILYKTVGTLCAHAGFDSGMLSALQVLTDVADEFLRRFTHLLRVTVNREEIYGNSGFPDPMERVFYEMGFGSMVCLHDYYQTRILQYRDKCEARSLSLIQKYKTLVPTIVKKEPDEVVRFKTEMEDEEDIPEIHFPNTAEGDCVDELQTSLEPGFQMLHSLEQEVAIKYGTE